MRSMPPLTAHTWTANPLEAVGTSAHSRDTSVCLSIAYKCFITRVLHMLTFNTLQYIWAMNAGDIFSDSYSQKSDSACTLKSAFTTPRSPPTKQRAARHCIEPIAGLCNFCSAWPFLCTRGNHIQSNYFSSSCPLFKLIYWVPMALPVLKLVFLTPRECHRNARPHWNPIQPVHVSIFVIVYLLNKYA